MTTTILKNTKHTVIAFSLAAFVATHPGAILIAEHFPDGHVETRSAAYYFKSEIFHLDPALVRQLSVGTISFPTSGTARMVVALGDPNS